MGFDVFMGWFRVLIVYQKKLQAAITQEKLLAGSKTLLSFAEKYPGRTRITGSNGHNDTVNWLKSELEALDYYDVSLQEFFTVVMVSGTVNTFTVDGEAVEALLFDFSGSGNATAPLVVVNNLGCEAVRRPRASKPTSTNMLTHTGRLSRRRRRQNRPHLPRNMQLRPEVCSRRRCWRRWSPHLQQCARNHPRNPGRTTPSRRPLRRHTELVPGARSSLRCSDRWWCNRHRDLGCSNRSPKCIDVQCSCDYQVRRPEQQTCAWSAHGLCSCGTWYQR